MSSGKAPQGSGFWRTSWGAALCVFVAGAALAFILEHRVHALQWLPYALLLACPLVHFFMHRGHGHHAASGDHKAGGCCGGTRGDREGP